MEELVKLVEVRTGLNEEKAQELVDEMLAIVRKKLPPSLRPMMESLLKGESGGLLSGLFGNR
jgi:hypothetical protein